MNWFSIPWLELGIILPLLGAFVSTRFQDTQRLRAWSLTIAVLTFASTFFLWLEYYLALPDEITHAYDIQGLLFGRTLFAVDELSAPLVPLVALIHLLTSIATTQAKLQRFSFGIALFSESIRIAIFCCVDEPWVLIGLLTLATTPPAIDLMARQKSLRLYVIHMGLFVGLLFGGWSLVENAESIEQIPTGAILMLLAAVLIRCGTVPFHTWVTDLFHQGSFGNALLFFIPLTGVYAAVRLVLPIAPDWVLHSLGVVSLLTAVYAAGMATVQRDARRCYAYIFTSHASLVLLGLELATHVSLTGALALWFSIAISLGGFGLSLRAVEARFGRLPLTEYRGLYDQSPTLAVCFLLTGLASVGFPGTVGFISAELLVDGAIHANLPLGLGIVFAAALNGIAVVRAYFMIFTGSRHSSSISLQITPRERIVLLIIAALILGGGFYPQPGIYTRHKAAEQLIKIRTERHITDVVEKVEE